MGIRVNIYLEDWSNGMRESQDYVLNLMDHLCNVEIDRFMLPDTLGILNPDEAYAFCKIMIDRYPSLNFDFHAHNDYGLAISNTTQAVLAGIDGIHTTVNGLGERTGNASLFEVVVVLKDHYNIDLGL